MDDDLIIDAKGSPSAPSKSARQHLSHNKGAWKLLDAPGELFLALRERPDGLMEDLSELHPKGAVLAGDLAEMQPSDLLNFLHQGRRTGVLLARSDGIERGLALIDGNVAWACSTSPAERLGELLHHMGLVDRGRVEAALAEQGEKGQRRRIGQILVDKGVLAPDEVWRGLRYQVVEIFLGLLVARAGTFVFLRGLDRTKLPAMLALDTQAMLLDGLRRLDEMELYRTRVPDSDVKPRRTGKKGAIDAGLQRLVALADGKRTLAELAAVTALGEFEVTKAVFKLLESGQLEI
ncbi:MAG: DUF4388 domain-containing protein [Deltaproteobacteria bacterium]|nr:MAG: DUF4388 domain-containing protein [Deltaproteobacteria bacterium]